MADPTKDRKQEENDPSRRRREDQNNPMNPNKEKRDKEDFNKDKERNK